MILFAVLFGCTTWSWSVTLTGLHWLKVFVHQVLRKIFGPMMDGVRGDRKKSHFWALSFEHQTKD